MDNVRIALIGAGQIGNVHLENYRNISQADVVAVCDKDRALAERAAERWGIAHVYEDYSELLKRDDIDAVDVCLHNNLHARASIDALEAGKHVYCEKPIADSYANGQAMLEAAKHTGKMLHIQLGELYHPYCRAVKRLVDGGALGEIYHARSMGFRRRFRPYVDGYGSPLFVQKKHAGGGALFDMGVYHISLMLYLMGMPALTRVSGSVYQKTAMDEARRQASGYDVEELAVGLAHFDGGITMDLFESWAVHLDSIDPCSLLGAKGGVKFGPGVFSYHTTLCDLELDCTGDLDAMVFRWENTSDTEYAYASSQAHWVAALQGVVPLLPTAQIALDTMLIQEGLYLSHKLGREVEAQEIIAASMM